MILAKTKLLAKTTILEKTKTLAHDVVADIAVYDDTSERYDADEPLRWQHTNRLASQYSMYPSPTPTAPLEPGKLTYFLRASSVTQSNNLNYSLYTSLQSVKIGVMMITRHMKNMTRSLKLATLNTQFIFDERVEIKFRILPQLIGDNVKINMHRQAPRQFQRKPLGHSYGTYPYACCRHQCKKRPSQV